MKLTQRDLDDLKPGTYTDDSLQGLRYRVRASGVRSWELRYTLKATGERASVTIGRGDAMKLTVAREKAKTLLAGVFTGGDPRREIRHAGGITVGGLIDRYLAENKFSDKTLFDWRRIVRVELSTILDLPASSLKRSAARALLSGIVENGSGYIANQAFAILSAAYAWGVDKDLLDGSPFVGMKKPFLGMKKSERWLTADELRALLQAIDALNRDPTWTRSEGQLGVTELLLRSGVRLRAANEARKSGFYNLNRPDVAEWRVAPIYRKVRAKNRHKVGPHVVPLPGQVIALVKAQLEQTRGAEILFPRRRAKRKAEVQKETITIGARFMSKLKSEMNARLSDPAERWTLHNFRHTIATHLLGWGVPQPVVDGIIDHATPRYIQAQPKMQRDALQDWNDWLDALRWAPMLPPSRA